MRLVADASVLVGELLRTRGRQLVANPALQLYVPEGTWEEAVHELTSRIDGMVRHGRVSRTAADELLSAAIALVETAVVIVPEVVYASVRDRASRRVLRDPADWPTVALAMMIDAGIWTADADFLGCGIPTWTTDTLIAELEQ